VVDDGPGPGTCRGLTVVIVCIIIAFSPFIVAIIDALYMYFHLRVTAVRKELRKFLMKACEE
jgi:hypothetical protein